MTHKIIDAFAGLAVGDALGVPVEFLKKEALQKNPVTKMMGYGTHNQPIGTWSDDSSLAFCLAESLCGGYDLNDIAHKFVAWYQEAYWTPHGVVFDIGISTSQALWKLKQGTSPLNSGKTGEMDNGNGSLMRILPLVFYIKNKPIVERFKIIKEVSGLTHAHIRSVLACFMYCEMALQLLQGLDKKIAYQNMQQIVNDFLKEHAICSRTELDKFHRILENPIGDYNILSLIDYKEEEISASGYVVHTLEASLWCFLKMDNYKETVLKAVNLGDDTDTTACVVGGLAGIYYGFEGIPKNWWSVLVKKEAILDLANRLNAKYGV